MPCEVTAPVSRGNDLLMDSRMFQRATMDCRVLNLDEGSLSHYNDSRGKCFIDISDELEMAT